MPFKSDKQRRYLWSQKPEVAKQIAYKQDGGGVYSAGLSDDAADWWNRRMAGIPQHRGYADDPDEITEAIGQNPDDRITYNNPGLINPNVKRPMHYVDMATYYTPGERAMGRDEMQQAKMAEANRRLREEAMRRGFVNKDGSLNFNSGGDVPMMGMKPKKVTQKDRYGNQVSVEFEPDVKPLDQTAIVKQMMEEVPMPMGMMMGYDHPGEPQGTDTVPAWLTPGEFVVNAEATEMYGPQIEAMNNHGRAIQQAQGGSVPRFANGGSVPMPAPAPWSGRPEGLTDLLHEREGFRDDIYLDTLNKPTVGYGHLLPDEYASRVGERPFSQQQLETWFDEDSAGAVPAAVRNVGRETWVGLNEQQQAALASMAFQLGETGQGKFKNMLEAVRSGDNEAVQREAKDSKWYEQTPTRVNDIIAAFPVHKSDGGVIPAPGVSNPETDLRGPIYAFAGISPAEIAAADVAEIEDPMADMSGSWAPPVYESDAISPMEQAILDEERKAAALDRYKQNRAATEAGQHVPNLGGMAAYPDIEDTGVQGVVDNAADAAALAAAEEETTINEVIANTDWTDQYEAAAAQEAIGEAQAGTVIRQREVERQEIETKRWGAMSSAVEARQAAESKAAEAEGLAAAGLHDKAAVAATEAEALAAEATAAETAAKEASAELDAHYETAAAEVEKGNKPGPEDDRATLSELIEDPEGNAEDNPEKPSEKGQQSDEEVVATGEAAAKAEPEKAKKAENFFKSAFKDLFDPKELTRMAIMYMGSRALGYSHHGSLTWAAKGYLGRLENASQAKAAQKAKLEERAFELAKTGKYTPQAITNYQKTGDLSYLQAGQSNLTQTGKTKDFIINGKSVRAIEVKDANGNVNYLQPNGKPVNLFNARETEPAFQKGTPEYRTRRSRATTDAAGRFEEVFKNRDTFYTGSGHDRQTNHFTDIRPKQAADEFWAFAEGMGLDPESDEALLIMTNAYDAAIADAKSSEGKVKPHRLTKYLEQEYIRETTGAPELFVTNSADVAKGKARPQYVRSDKMNELNASIGALVQASPANISNDIVYSEMIAAWSQLDESDKKRYNNSAATGESGFYLFTKDELGKLFSQIQ